MKRDGRLKCAKCGERVLKTCFTLSNRLCDACMVNKERYLKMTKEGRDARRALHPFYQQTFLRRNLEPKTLKRVEEGRRPLIEKSDADEVIRQAEKEGVSYGKMRSILTAKKEKPPIKLWKVLVKHEDTFLEFVEVWARDSIEAEIEARAWTNKRHGDVLRATAVGEVG